MTISSYYCRRIRAKRIRLFQIDFDPMASQESSNWIGNLILKLLLQGQVHMCKEQDVNGGMNLQTLFLWSIGNIYV